MITLIPLLRVLLLVILGIGVAKFWSAEAFGIAGLGLVFLGIFGYLTGERHWKWMFFNGCFMGIVILTTFWRLEKPLDQTQIPRLTL